MPRLLTIQRRLRQEFFSGSLAGPLQSWTCPPGVTNIVRMVGKGADGAANTWQTQTLMLAESVKSSVGAGTQNVSRADLQAYGATQGDLFMTSTATRSVTYTPATYITNPSNLTAVSLVSPVTKTVRSTGIISSAGGGLGFFTYANAGADYYRIAIQVDIGGTTGSNATALGRTFPGGVNAAAVVTEFYNTTVVPGNVYSFSIPVDAYVQLYYF